MNTRAENAHTQSNPPVTWVMVPMIRGPKNEEPRSEREKTEKKVDSCP